MNITSKLCELLVVNEKELVSFASTAPYRYKVYSIPKRNSKGVRVIAHPSKELKFIQRVVVDLLRNDLTPSCHAYAYVQNKNIKANALAHVDSKYILKMDFENFFPSITPTAFFNKAEKFDINFSKIDKEVLTGLLFRRQGRNGSLAMSIGAPSSPMLSNFFMKEFDLAVNEQLEGRSICYTRYADDLTFSTKVKDILFDIPKLVVDILLLKDYKELSFNREKTVFSSKGHNRHVTGITLSNNNKITVGRERKRTISAMVHGFKMGRLAEEKVLMLKGWLAFAEHIEPGFTEKMELKYGKDTIEELKKRR